MTNYLQTITNWKLPIELEKFSRQLAELSDEHTDIPAELIEEALANNVHIMHYINVLLAYMHKYEALSDAIASNLAELSARKKRYDARIDSIEQLLKKIIDRFDLKKIECPNGTVTKVIKSNGKVNVLDENKLMKENPHLFVYPEPVLNKVALKKALLNDEKIDGACLVNSEYIQVRR